MRVLIVWSVLICLVVLCVAQERRFTGTVPPPTTKVRRGGRPADRFRQPTPPTISPDFTPPTPPKPEYKLTPPTPPTPPTVPPVPPPTEAPPPPPPRRNRPPPPTEVPQTLDEASGEDYPEQRAETPAPKVKKGPTKNPKLTGDPRHDFKFDPNLPRELNGYDLSVYPFYVSVPEGITFECEGHHDGYYASIPHSCQVFHYCVRSIRYDFLCANYTVFDQETFNCRFVNNVKCGESEKHYKRNEELYKPTTTTTTRRPRRTKPPREPEYYDDDEEYDEDYYDEEGDTTTTTRRPRRKRPKGGRGGHNRGGRRPLVPPRSKNSDATPEKADVDAEAAAAPTTTAVPITTAATKTTAAPKTITAPKTTIARTTTTTAAPVTTARATLARRKVVRTTTIRTTPAPPPPEEEEYYDEEV